MAHSTALSVTRVLNGFISAPLIGVLAFFSLETTVKRRVASNECRNDAKNVCFSLKSKLYTLSVAKCISLSLQVIAP